MKSFLMILLLCALMLCLAGLSATAEDMTTEEAKARVEVFRMNNGIVYGFAGLAAALSEFSLPQKENALFGELEKALREKQGIRIHGYHKSGRYVPVLLFNKQGVDCEGLAERLARWHRHRLRSP